MPQHTRNGANYVLVGSQGGAPTHPVWVHNLRVNPAVEIRDLTLAQPMRVREVADEVERARLWTLAVAAFPPWPGRARGAGRDRPRGVAPVICMRPPVTFGDA